MQILCKYANDMQTCKYYVHVVYKRRNRDEKKSLEFDWSDKKEADELDTKCVILRNEDTNKQFYPGAARFQEMYAPPFSHRTCCPVIARFFSRGRNAGTAQNLQPSPAMVRVNIRI